MMISLSISHDLCGSKCKLLRRLLCYSLNISCENTLFDSFSIIVFVKKKKLRLFLLLLFCPSFLEYLIMMKKCILP